MARDLGFHVAGALRQTVGQRLQTFRVGAQQLANAFGFFGGFRGRVAQTFGVVGNQLADFADLFRGMVGRVLQIATLLFHQFGD